MQHVRKTAVRQLYVHENAHFASTALAHEGGMMDGTNVWQLFTKWGIIAGISSEPGDDELGSQEIDESFSSDEYHPKRTYTYVLSDFMRNSTINDFDAKVILFGTLVLDKGLNPSQWVVDNIDLSEQLMKFREMSVKLAMKKDALSDMRIL